MKGSGARERRMKLKPYPEYKDSGVPWLSTIPSAWRILYAKHIFKTIDIRSKTGKEELLSVSEKKGVTPRKFVNVTMFKAESYMGYKLCWPGDLVINSLWAWMQGLGFSRYHGIVSSAYGVYRLKTTDNNYAYIDYLIRSKAYLWEFRVNSKGIWKSRYQLTDEAFFSIPIILPSLSEQTQIARFLDWKMTQIAKFIKAKKRIIELLKEQKQVIINDAITGKIDVTTGKPYLKYKFSNIEWLDRVPERWEIRKIKYITKMKSGENITSISIEKEGKYPVYGGNGLRGYYSHFTHNGEFLLIGRQGALCGNVHLVSGKFWASEHAVVTTIIVSCPIKWLYYLLIIMNLNQYSESAAQPGISVEKIQNLRTLYPPKNQQELIATYIEKKIKNIDLAISRTEREIALIQEYRDRLIADVVTGKIDVRDIKVPEVSEELLPDEPDIDDNETGEAETAAEED